MKNNSVGFCIFYDWLDVFELLSKEDVSDIIMALGRYYTDGISPTERVSQTARPTLMMMLRQIERAKKRAERDTKTETETETKTETETETEKNKETKTNTRTRSRSCSDSCEKISGEISEPWEKSEEEGEDIGVGVRVREREQRENIPTLSEVERFVRENGLVNTKPGQFYAYNEKRGWKMNNEPISDWRTMLCKWDKKRGERFAESKGKRERKLEKDDSYYEKTFLRAVERSMKKQA